MIEAVASLGGIGLLSALALGVAARKFAVESDPRETAILDVLSGANCGACGYPGCAAYAKAVASGEAATTLCTPGGVSTLEKLAHIMGVEAVIVEPQVASVLCQGDNVKAKAKYQYLGISDCVAAQKIADGPKTCPAGCLGLGTCARVCPFDAIEITPQGLAVVDHERCTGCKKCVAACPRQVIAMIPTTESVQVLCNSHDKGALVRKYCQIGCIGCRICQKTVPEAYAIEDELARVVFGRDGEAAAAVSKCPTKCIRDFTTGYPEGSALKPAMVPAKRSAA
ncbi:MAG TPA: RnfABCDGE type electron transport complex subunit B [Desulfuromonadales bacterium]|nr:RnfABCDGE type electron transport complex subunit B [Desulfuromonadales bacterium]